MRSSIKKAEDYLHCLQMRLHIATRFSTPNSIRRIILIIQVLEGLTLYRYTDSNAFEYVRCIKLFFRTIPDSFVSKNEIQDFLRSSYFENKITEGIINSITKDYERLYIPQSIRPYGPNSLKHMCRVTIRRHCKEALPESLERMGIPKRWRNFLLCNTG